MEGKMNCDECKNLITLSVYGKLTPEEKAQLETHLRDCSRCANIYERSTKLSNLINEQDNIPLPDKEKSWQIISAKALRRKGGWFGRFVPQKPAFQLSYALLLLVVGLTAGYFIRSYSLGKSEIAQLRQEVLQVREIAAASLVRQESLNSRLREISTGMPLAQSDERPLRYLFRTLIGGTEETSVVSQPEQTSPLVNIALTLIRQINRSDVY